jgi:hypothetical protein
LLGPFAGNVCRRSAIPSDRLLMQGSMAINSDQWPNRMARHNRKSFRFIGTEMGNQIRGREMILTAS